MTSGRDVARVAVRINPDVWRDEVERFGKHSEPRIAADRERQSLEEHGVRLQDLQRCADDGPDGTRLGGLVKVYVPISQAPPSERPSGLVLSPGKDEDGTYVAVVAFGERHPRRGSRSVYGRAHKRLHGRYHDQ